jgi:hypothetical protein
MSRSDIDRKDGAEPSCQLLAARAPRRNNVIVLRHQFTNLIATIGGKTVGQN